MTEVAKATIFLSINAGGNLTAFMNREDLVAQLGEEAPVFSNADELKASEVPLAEIVGAYNKIATKKVRGFKDRDQGSKELFGALEAVAASKTNQADAGSEAEKLAAAVKPKKAKKEKAEGTGTGRASPLAGKFWSRSGAAIKGRRLNGSGVGINALKYIIANPGCSTEEYLEKSGGGRYVDLQYDLDHGNIVVLSGATPEERQAEIAKLAESRKAAEAAEAEKLAKAEAEKKAKAEAAEKAKAEKKAAEDKAAADKKAADEKAAAEAKGKEAAKA